MYVNIKEILYENQNYKNNKSKSKKYHQQSNKIFPRQATLLPKSKLSKENGTSQNGHDSAENV